MLCSVSVPVSSTRLQRLGSTTVYPYGDPAYAPVELGGSIFVDANKNMMRASKDFNLSLSDFGDEFSDMGIWDGSKFVFVVSTTCPSHPVTKHLLILDQRWMTPAITRVGGRPSKSYGDMVTLLQLRPEHCE